METTKTILVSVFFGALAGAAIAFSLLSFSPMPSQNKLIGDFYLTENAAHVSPHSLRKLMDRGDIGFVLVDLRSAEEYEKEHIIGAVSIPAYKDKDTSDYGAVDRIVGNFSMLPKDKDIVVYCYSIPCMTGRKVGKMLAEHGIFVKQLGIGWNEWRYDWTGWNHEHEWNITNASDYVFSGSAPGAPKKSNSTACPIDNQFGC